MLIHLSNERKIAIIGCGNLGKSILNGLLNTKEISPNNITVTKRNLKVRKSTNKSFNKTSNNIEAVINSGNHFSD